MAVELVRGAGVGEGEFVGGETDDGAVAGVQGVDVEGAVAGDGVEGEGDGC